MKNGPYELVIAPVGYPGKLYRGRYAYEHHVVWWEHTSKRIPKGFEVHHINGDHRDNRIDNLKLLTQAQHRAVHGKLQTEQATLVIFCGFCDKEFYLLKSKVKTRLLRSKYDKIFCSQSCSAKHQYKAKDEDYFMAMSSD